MCEIEELREGCEFEGGGEGLLCSPNLIKPLPSEGCEIEEFFFGGGRGMWP